jgi:oligopeptide/dipeptide ABC transporter ATP-binding protein
MGVVAELADWAAVMYAGRIVEHGTVDEIFDAPAHPYTQGLLQTRRDLRSGAIGAPLFQIPGSPPSPEALPSGCPFRPRCPRATGVCAEQDPPLRPLTDGAAHAAACHHPGSVPA